MTARNKSPEGPKHEMVVGVLTKNPLLLMGVVTAAVLTILAYLEMAELTGDHTHAMGSSEHWTPAAPHGGTHEVSDSDYYGDCPPSPTGHHTWVRRMSHNPRDEHGNSAYSTEWQVCVNCGAYFN